MGPFWVELVSAIAIDIANSAFVIAQAIGLIGSMLHQDDDSTDSYVFFSASATAMIFVAVAYALLLRSSEQGHVSSDPGPQEGIPAGDGDPGSDKDMAERGGEPKSVTPPAPATFKDGLEHTWDAPCQTRLYLSFRTSTLRVGRRGGVGSHLRPLHAADTRDRQLTVPVLPSPLRRGCRRAAQGQYLRGDLCRGRGVPVSMTYGVFADMLPPWVALLVLELTAIIFFATTASPQLTAQYASMVLDGLPRRHSQRLLSRRAPLPGHEVCAAAKLRHAYRSLSRHAALRWTRGRTECAMSLFSGQRALPLDGGPLGSTCKRT